jgi:hypothetical protein
MLGKTGADVRDRNFESEATGERSSGFFDRHAFRIDL